MSGFAPWKPSRALPVASAKALLAIATVQQSGEDSLVLAQEPLGDFPPADPSPRWRSCTHLSHRDGHTALPGQEAPEGEPTHSALGLLLRLWASGTMGAWAAFSPPAGDQPREVGGVSLLQLTPGPRNQGFL